MRSIKEIWLVLGCLVWIACNPQPDIHIPSPGVSAYGSQSMSLDKATYRDKVLGALVGSAIGDAMGASTEMWHRDDIRKVHGFINNLTPAIRTKSPEGTWKHNMLSGSTTDDTRWKQLTVNYIAESDKKVNPKAYANLIVEYFNQEVSNLSSSARNPVSDDFIEATDRMQWIQEWARVAEAYVNDEHEYDQVLSRFYGGEMSCAGLLYSPVFGLIGNGAEEAYMLAFDHAIFDIGYAKDISGLSAAMTRVAIEATEWDSVLKTFQFVDPYSFTNSRLVGRIAAGIADETKSFFDHLGNAAMDTADVSIPESFPYGKKEWLIHENIYDHLEERQRHIPFHAGEIWQILYAGLYYGKGDFNKSMQFIINYGRDNDTVGAVAGMILGAYVGYNDLPNALKEMSIRVNKEVVGIDLEELAHKLADYYYPE